MCSQESKPVSQLARVLAAALVDAALTNGAGSPTCLSTGQFVGDRAITIKIKTRSLDGEKTRGFDIHVTQFKGSVELTGFVRTDADKRWAGEFARSIARVKSVVNDLVIKAGA